MIRPDNWAFGESSFALPPMASLGPHGRSTAVPRGASAKSRPWRWRVRPLPPGGGGGKGGAWEGGPSTPSTPGPRRLTVTWSALPAADVMRGRFHRPTQRRPSTGGRAPAAAAAGDRSSGRRAPLSRSSSSVSQRRSMNIQWHTAMASNGPRSIHSAAKQHNLAVRAEGPLRVLLVGGRMEHVSVVLI